MPSEDFQDQAEETVRSLPETVKMVILQPAAYFQTMPRSGGFLSPLIFLLVMSAIYAVIVTVITAVSIGGVEGAVVFGILLGLVLIVIGAVVTSAILCVIWMMMGSKERFEASFRFVCYTSTISPIVAVLSVIPYFSTIVWVVWGTWLTVLASVHLHHLPRNRAVTVFGIIGAVFLALSLAGEYAGQRSLQQLEELQGQIEGLDPTNPEDAAKIRELMEQMQEQR